MKINLRFFSSYKDVIGRGEMSLDLPAGTTLEAMLQRLADQFPRLEVYKDVVILAVNRDFADLDVKLKDGDEVALMPPVGGG